MKIKFNNITKTFGSVVANDSVSFQIESGTIHAIIGENGAGKSTLVKILAGLIEPDSGEIYVNDQILKMGSVKESQKLGIGILGQDPWDFANLTIIDSFIVGSNHLARFIDYKKMKKMVGDYCTKYGLVIDVNTLVRNLSVGERQQIELFRLLFNGVKVIILDEPTSAFSLDQKQLVFETLKRLVKDGYSIILVSHKIDEVLEICTRATIMRSSQVVDTLNIPVASDKLIDLMFGVNNDRSINQKAINQKAINQSYEYLTINSYGSGDGSHTEFKEITEGCILGIAGLQGSGADGFVKSIFSSSKYNTSISKNIGKDNLLNNRANVTYIPSDRLERGLFSDLSILEHFALIKAQKNSLIDWRNVKNESSSLLEEFDIKGTIESKASHLSGGNQQRLMLALIDKTTEILLMEQPTRGLDILSAKFVWDRLVESKEEKVLTVFSSYDIDEICMYSDYIICFHGDSISGYGSTSNLSKLDIVNLISGRVNGKA